MKNFLAGKLIALVLLVSASTLPNKAQAAKDDRLAISLCESAKSNNRSIMRKKLRQARLRLRDIYEGLRCGKEGSLMRVAINADSIDAVKYILAKAKKSALSKVDKDGKDILQYAQGLVAAGDDSKQVYVEMIQSQ